MKPPVFDIDPSEFSLDPYPTYQRMRAEAPICYVPQLDAVLLTRRDDIFVCEKNIEVFSSRQPNSLMTRLMGENMMRKDGAAHMRERKAIFPTVSPKTVAKHWKCKFEAAADTILDDLADRETTDIVADYAMRLSAESLKIVTGLEDVSWQAMDAWSQAMIDGVANYGADPAVEARCVAATREIDAAIYKQLGAGAFDPHSLLGSLSASNLPEEALRLNIRLAISGGQNEQRDAIAGCVWAMLKQPGQRKKLETGIVDWPQVFEEYCRWIAPIGMSPRRINSFHSFAGVDFEPEQRVFLMFGSANRDETCFNSPERFDVARDTSKAISFGAGPHFCAGAWVSRCLVAEVALPKLFNRFPQITIANGVESQFTGWAFRGLKRLPVVLH